MKDEGTSGDSRRDKEMVKVNFHLYPTQYSTLRIMTTMCRHHSISRLVDIAALGFVSATIQIDEEVYDKIKYVDTVGYGETVMASVTIQERTVRLARMEAERLGDTMSNYLRNAVACMLDEIDERKIYSLQRDVFLCLEKWEQPGTLLDARRITVGDIDPKINEAMRSSEIPRDRPSRKPPFKLDPSTKKADEAVKEKTQGTPEPPEMTKKPNVPTLADDNHE